MAAVCEAAGLRHVAIDGKAVRSALRNTFSGCLHLVSAWAAENRLILGQEAVGSHEIAAIPELLKVLDLHGALVTFDAAGCQKEIAGQVREQGGDYSLAVKGNQSALHDAVLAAFGRAFETDFAGLQFDEDERADTAHYYVTSLRGTAAELGPWSAATGGGGRAALGARRGVPRGRQPDGGRVRRGEPRADPAGGGVAAEAGPGQGGYQGQAADCGPG
jgi:hypothetical protein